jgi:hypothetical protein
MFCKILTVGFTEQLYDRLEWHLPDAHGVGPLWRAGCEVADFGSSRLPEFRNAALLTEP